MRVDLVYTYVLLDSAPHDLKAHQWSFVLVNILVEKLELDGILNIEEREHYSQGVALCKPLAYSFH